MVKCSVEKCPKEVESCCQFCAGKDFCEFVCECKTPCTYQEPVRTEPKKKDKPLNLIISILILTMSIFLLGATGNMVMMQTDTLNALSETRQEIDDLSEENMLAGQVFQSDEKTLSTDNVSLTDAHREYITRVCMAEANSIDGMMAVAQVISDRSYLWNMTPIEVVQQDSQFASPAQGEISAEATQAVWAVFDEGMRAFDSNVTHFHSEGANPYWTENKEYVASRGGNRFYNSRYEEAINE